MLLFHFPITVQVPCTPCAILCQVLQLYLRIQWSVVHHPEVMQMFQKTLSHTAGCKTTSPPARLKPQTRAEFLFNASGLLWHLVFCVPLTPVFFSYRVSCVKWKRVNVFITARKCDFFSSFKICRSDVLLLYLPALETGSVTVALFQLPSHRALEKHISFTGPATAFQKCLLCQKRLCCNSE